MSKFSKNSEILRIMLKNHTGSEVAVVDTFFRMAENEGWGEGDICYFLTSAKGISQAGDKAIDEMMRLNQMVDDN